jgi:hypothetical protein
MTNLINEVFDESQKVKNKKDTTVYRVTEIFSQGRNMGEIMKRLVLKKAKNFKK